VSAEVITLPGVTPASRHPSDQARDAVLEMDAALTRLAALPLDAVAGLLVRDTQGRTLGARAALRALRRTVEDMEARLAGMTNGVTIDGR
jgi:hypothetical protein